MNVKAAIIHIIGDIVQSVGVVIASILIYFCPNWTVIDPICTITFSIIVICTTFNITKKCLSILMESSPDKVNADEIEKTLKTKVSFY